MQKLLHWGDKLNWTPIVVLGIAAIVLFLARMLTAWFYMRTLQAIHRGASNEDSIEESVARIGKFFDTRKPAVPPIVSSLYFLSGVTLIVAALWGLFGTAWWMLPLGLVCWNIVHIPYRDLMESWASFQNTSWVSEDTDALLKGGLTADQEAVIKKRLGLDR